MWGVSVHQVQGSRWWTFTGPVAYQQGVIHPPVKLFIRSRDLARHKTLGPCLRLTCRLPEPPGTIICMCGARGRQPSVSRTLENNREQASIAWKSLAPSCRWRHFCFARVIYPSGERSVV